MPVSFRDPPPLSPGEVLRDLFLPQLGLTQEALATALGVSRVTLNQMLNGRRAVTADMALRLARVLGTTPQRWLVLQNEVDLWRAQRRDAATYDALLALRPRNDTLAPTSRLEELVRDQEADA